MYRFLFIFAVLIWATGPVEAQSRGVAAVGEQSFDFGVVPRGAKRVHVFSVINSSDQTIRITSIRVPCSCVSATASKKNISPGEIVTVDAVLDTSRYSGPVQKTFYVGFDRPGSEEIRFNVQALSDDSLIVQPDTFAFGRVKINAPAATSIVVTLTDSRSATTWTAVSESDFIECKVEPTSIQGFSSAFRITASIRPDLPTGTWYSAIRLTPNTPGAATISVPLTISVEP